MKFGKIFSAKILKMAIFYAALAFVSICAAFMLRFDFSLADAGRYFCAKIVLLVVFAKLLCLALFGQFRVLLKFFYIADFANLCKAFALSAAAVFCASRISIHYGWVIPRGVVLTDFFLSVFLFVAARMALRIYSERSIAGKTRKYANKRVAIIGAGEVGSDVAANLLSHKSLGVIPVVFLDDDENKIGSEISGLEVVSLKTDFKSLAERYSINKAIIAISKIPRARINEITAAFSKIGVETSIVPSYQDLTLGIAKVSDLHEVSIEDVLGREQAVLKTREVAEMVQGKCVLVTGAGGSIGSELCRQIAMYSPRTVVMFDHCEVQLFKAQQNILRGNFGAKIEAVVGSVADESRIESAVEAFKPDIIFHAAAHKHVPMMEYQAAEALKNNALGTWNTAVAASKNGVKKFIFISTDKAVNPTSVMGATKRLAEILVQAMRSSPENKTVFAAVRFGNVLGSSGSVVPVFKRQIADGGPVTLTHPDVMRYFMSIPEAVGLVMQSAVLARGGEIFVLDMGEQIKIADLARQMIRLSGFEPDIDIKIEIVGLREGEKLYEELRRECELLEKTQNPKIYAFVSQPRSFAEAEEIVAEIKKACLQTDNAAVKSFIKSVVPEYKSHF